jgi:hypothetical protein
VTGLRKPIGHWLHRSCAPVHPKTVCARLYCAHCPGPPPKLCVPVFTVHTAPVHPSYLLTSLYSELCPGAPPKLCVPVFTVHTARVHPQNCVCPSLLSTLLWSTPKIVSARLYCAHCPGPSPKVCARLYCAHWPCPPKLSTSLSLPWTLPSPPQKLYLPVINVQTLFSQPVIGGSRVLWNVGFLVPDSKTLHPRRQSVRVTNVRRTQFWFV